MKNFILSLFISYVVMTQSVFAAPANLTISYLTSWGISGPAEKEIIRSKADILMLSFGQWDANGNIQVSDDIIAIPNNTYWINVNYLTWTHFKLGNPNKKVMIAFGGQTYESIWSHLTTADSRERIAQNLISLLSQDYPVFKKVDASNQYVRVGVVQIDGIDFDFEKVARLTVEENTNLLDLAKRLRQKAALLPDKKLLSLTSYHVGADPVSCLSAAVTQDCSYIEPSRSTHHGEVLTILKGGKDIFDIFNVMAYDAGPRFKYDIAMKNYAAVIGKPSKVLLGNSINTQWGPEGNFTETHSKNIERAAWQARNNYGGFFIWTLGSSTQGMSFAEQVNYLNAMIDASKSAVRTR
ncbi:glycoside hydrolase family 18 protein [Rahnella variigena]|uniref:glycoside hydrolase family 18 protein n=1 Tax=Rahnella variigena TaxID=574964 RepID=UPI0013304751|nr:glycoside hydrolase family 18 protein [Rahnella variigena]